MKRIAIVMDGGLIQAIVSDEDLSDIEVLVVDYDTDGAEDSELTLVPQGDNTNAAAVCSLLRITKAAIDIKSIEV